MPWKVSGVLEKRARFAVEYESGRSDDSLLPLPVISRSLHVY
jgi:hypothetical protein